MNSYTLRSAAASDQPEIKKMIRYARLNPVGIRWPRFVVAVDPADKVIGCSQIKSHRDGSQELASLVVRRSWRKQGVARALVERLRQEASETLWLTCASHLIPFYNRLGFYEVNNRQQMPPYFRFVKRLFSMFAFVWGSQEYLAVMRDHE